MLPYGVGADSISARAIWGNAKPHGRALLAPTMHFFDSLKASLKGRLFFLQFKKLSRPYCFSYRGCAIINTA